jgi:hypothetical protein
MAFYFTPFKVLSSNDVSYLLDRDNQKEKLIYIDCLALLHDILASFTTTEEHSLFEVSWIKTKTTRSIEQFQPQASSIKDNIRVNLKSAEDLYGELTSTARTVTRFVALSYVDAYMTTLLDQYRNLRYPRLP